MKSHTFKKYASLLIENIYNKIDLFHASRVRKFYQDQFIDCVIDVGSHKGEFINLICRDNVSIFSFEPQKSLQDDLINNTKKKNVLEYFDIALSSFQGEIDLHINYLTSTTSTLIPNEQSFWVKFKKLILGGSLTSGIESVKVNTMDNVLFSRLDQFKSILLKIDVEGAEGDVLLGAEKIIDTHNIKYIQVEDSSYNTKNIIKTNFVSNFLIEKGFQESKSFIFPLLNFKDLIFTKKQLETKEI